MLVVTAMLSLMYAPTGVVQRLIARGAGKPLKKKYPTSDMMPIGSPEYHALCQRAAQYELTPHDLRNDPGYQWAKKLLDVDRQATRNGHPRPG